jgi:cell division septation protein DedD
MSTVEELIGDLLLRHNCVVIPSFGGFVAKKTSATIDYKNGVMYPPKKSVLFNRQLINNDGLLVAEFSTVNKVLYTEAEQAIALKTNEWNEKLRNGERVTLDKVGYLFFDQEKNLCFEQDRFFNLLLESYGLGKVHFVSEEDIEVAKYVKAVQEQQAIEEQEKKVAEPFQLVALPSDATPREIQEVVIVEHPQSRRFSKAWRYIAAAVLAPIGFYSFWIPMNSNVLESGVLSVNDFNLSYKATEGKYNPEAFNVSHQLNKKSSQTIEQAVASLPSDVYVYSYPFDEDTYMTVKVKDGEAKQETIIVEEEIQPEIKVESKPKQIIEPKVTPIAKASPVVVKVTQTAKATPVVKPTVKEVVKVEKKQEKTVVESGKLNFVVGSFSSKENAQVLIDKMTEKGFNAYIMSESKGSFRVSAGKAKTEEEIRLISKKSKESGFDGWILR